MAAIITDEFIKQSIPEGKVKHFMECSGFHVAGDVSYNVSHPDDRVALVTLTIPVEEAFCYHCTQWRTGETLMNIYGEGMGYCDCLHEPKAGTHRICLGFQSRE